MNLSISLGLYSGYCSDIFIFHIHTLLFHLLTEGIKKRWLLRIDSSHYKRQQYS